MNSNTNIIDIIKILKKTYPDAKCSLDFNNEFQLGISVMLSAQCTDERVNKVTPELFEKYKTPEDFVNIDINELEKMIHSCGFYKAKAKNIKVYANRIINEYDGKLPNQIDKLVTLPGIGRKSANVIMLEAFGIDSGIAVDTHVKRISNRLGLSKNSNPTKIEEDLINLIPKKYFRDVNHLFIWHGRNICTAQKPKCETCPIKSYCNFKSKI